MYVANRDEIDSPLGSQFGFDGKISKEKNPTYIPGQRRNHTGIVAVDDVWWSKKERKQFVRTLVHEIGHGLGAPHVTGELGENCESAKYFMGPGVGTDCGMIQLRRQSFFHQQSVKKMKKFILDTPAKIAEGHDLDVLREDSLRHLTVIP